MTTLAEQMAITLVHDGGGTAKFTPAVEGRVWYDTYFQGASIFHSTLKTEDVAGIIMELMHKGYYIPSV